MFKPNLNHAVILIATIFGVGVALVNHSPGAGLIAFGMIELIHCIVVANIVYG